MGHVEDKLMMWGACIRSRALGGPTQMPQSEEIAFILGEEGGGGGGSKPNVSNVFVEFCEVDKFLENQGKFVYKLFLDEYAWGVKDTSDSDHVFLVKTWTTDQWSPPEQCAISPAANILKCRPEQIVQWRVRQVKRKLAKEKGWQFEKKDKKVESNAHAETS